MDYQQKYLKYKEKYNNLKKLSSKKQYSQYGGEGLEVGQEIEGTINKIFYCGFSIKVNDKPLVLYIQKFGPAGGTLVPDMSKVSTPEELKVDNITKEEFTKFWLSSEIRQPNGNWKGGEWAPDNLITTSTSWVAGAFIGDQIKLKVVAKGIMGFAGGKQFKSEFKPGHIINPGSESQALSCEITFGDKTYAGYVTENIMPQVANDVLFIYKNNDGQRFIKLLKRGVGATVDMPKKMMPGAGEHLEPGSDIQLKGGLAGVLRAINEEIGIPKETLAQCYLLPIGKYDTPGRDPRYWTYCIERDEQLIEFGYKRGSQSQGYIVYFESPSGMAPVETNPLDTEEVNKKWWYPLNKTLLIDNDKWMIVDHKNLVVNAIIKLEQFNCMPQSEKDTYKME